MIKINFNKNFTLKITPIILSIFILLFIIVRILILLLNNSFFDTLTNAQIFNAFLQGLRFDFSIISLFILPSLLLFNLPINSKKWQKFWLSFICFEFIALAIFLVADLIYFPTVGRHIAQEIIQIKYELGFLVSYAIKGFWWLLIILALTFIGLNYLLYKLVDKYYKQTSFSIKNLLIVLVSFSLLFLLGIRGHLDGGKPLGVADVYKYSASQQEANLMINGAFTAYQIGRKGATDTGNTFPQDKAIENIKNYIQQDDLTFIDNKYPFVQTPQQKGTPKKLNFVIVMLEGWNPTFVGAYNQNGDTHTPYFDELAQGGALFLNAYSAGQRSIIGFAGIFAGLPLLNGLPMFGYGLEQATITPIAKHFRDIGYYTMFAQTSPRDSYRLCSLSALLGAEESYGEEDLPHYLNYQGKPEFGYDYDLLMFTADKIKNRTKDNFFVMLFTGTTHDPFAKTTDDFEIYKDNSWNSQYKNALAFADYSISKLIERAKQENWFDDTIFIFMADHIIANPSPTKITEKFHIPLLIYSPKHIKQGKYEQIVSQLDILPTIYNLANLQNARTTIGRDLFNTNKSRYAFINQGELFGAISEDGAILHNGKMIIEEDKIKDSFDAQTLANFALSVDKSTTYLLKNNYWYKEIKK